MKDLLIVGSGPAGYVAAIRAAQLGMNVALVEKEQLGGTCLNWGCIPTKVMYEAASLKKSIKKAAVYGIETGELTVHAETLINKRTQVVGSLREGIAGLLRKNSVEVIQGTFTFNAGKYRIDGIEYRAKKILLACGSIDDMPVFPGHDLPEVLSTKQLLTMDSLPHRMVIYGGGVAGVEFASILATLGCDVSLIKTGKHFFPFIDVEIDKRIGTYLKRAGVHVRTGMVLQQAVKSAGLFGCIFKDVDTGDVIDIEMDALLITKGRKANTNNLNLQDSGIDMDTRGFVVVDENYQTSRIGVYAVGDITGRRMLAHAASEEAVVAVERMAGIISAVDYNSIPNCVFMFPQVASVGKSEQQAESEGIWGDCGKFMFSSLGRAQAIGETDGFIKTVCDRSGKIIGVHMIGAEVNELVACAATAVHEGIFAEDFVRIVQAHPTFAEALRESALSVLHRAIH